MPATQYITLNTGAQMPTLGFGTWKSQPGAVETAVEVALKNGYKHIDTATAYGNENEVGEGMAASGVPRSEYFLTTKLNNNDHGRVLEALEYSLKQLRTDYLDLWLMHWPGPMNQDLKGPDTSKNWLDTWKKMEDVFKAHPEKVKAIGVSNVSVKYLEDLLKVAAVVPAVNQIERHPSCMQEDVVSACHAKGIQVTAYSPLGSDNSPLLENPVVSGLAAKYSVSPANILVSLHANTPGVSVLAKSVTPARIIANLKVVDLSEEDIAALKEIEKTAHFRVCNPNWTGNGNLGFTDC
ncbi:Aldo/keto reductase [Amylostereum chailletii]|nr:Aldo/keto reductase [Amylostereum chailletii]